MNNAKPKRFVYEEQTVHSKYLCSFNIGSRYGLEIGLRLGFN